MGNFIYNLLDTCFKNSVKIHGPQAFRDLFESGAVLDYIILKVETERLFSSSSISYSFFVEFKLSIDGMGSRVSPNSIYPEAYITTDSCLRSDIIYNFKRKEETIHYYQPKYDFGQSISCLIEYENYINSKTRFLLDKTPVMKPMSKNFWCLLKKSELVMLHMKYLSYLAPII